ncbi:MAG: AlpA family phage regulatory protein, partial [Desulfobulbaceae bacterium]|nr:AlpA family phage regulatory protein [Desulfobulbaceae bacterium]
PKPVRLGSRAVAWRADELKRWIDELPRAVS